MSAKKPPGAGTLWRQDTTGALLIVLSCYHMRGFNGDFVRAARFGQFGVRYDTLLAYDFYDGIMFKPLGELTKIS